ncbi:flavodoxin [bacterium]|nr:flavodoxin [bacterium]
MKVLVAYFSAEAGRTAAVAEVIADAISASIFEIKPAQPYSKADLRWINPFARCNKEKFGKKEVPVGNKVENFSDYDTVFLGFPIWYGCAPNVVNSFCKDYDWNGKRVFLFATSGGGGMGKSAEKLLPYMQGAKIAGEKLVKKPEEVKIWLEQVL